MPWQERNFGKLLLERCEAGDTILAAEFSRFAGSPMQVFLIMEVAAHKKVSIIITRNDFRMDTTLQGQIQAMVLGMASLIEVEFIRLRTREGLERARLEGRVGGRPKTSYNKEKASAAVTLYKQKESISFIEKTLSISRSTIYQYLRREGVVIKDFKKVKYNKSYNML